MENLRLGVSAVRHDMKREETVEEVEKNTELERQTPKRNVVRSSRARGAKKEKDVPAGTSFFYTRVERQNTTPWPSTVTRGLLMSLNLYHVSTSYFL